MENNYKYKLISSRSLEIRHIGMKIKIARGPPKVTTLIGMALVSSLVRGVEKRRAAVEGAQSNMPGLVGGHYDFFGAICRSQ